MKKVFTLIVGIVMIFAALIASGEPDPETPQKTIIVTEIVCVAVLVAGALWLRYFFKSEEKATK
jgi:hypothetical protein